ncbi:MAG: PspA/IM30 family protein [Hafnia sp.]
MFKQIWAIIRRMFSRSGQAIIDKNIVSLMEQQITDTKEMLRKSEEELVSITANRNLLLKQQDRIETELKELDQNLTTLMARPAEEINQDLANRLATKFAEKENELAGTKNDVNAKNIVIQKTKDAISSAKNKLTDFENRKDSVKSTETLIKATASIAAANSGANSHLRELHDSLERTEKLQEAQMARFDAAQEREDENNGTSLQEDMVKAGLISGGSTPESILERFKPKQPTAPSTTA